MKCLFTASGSVNWFDYFGKLNLGRDMAHFKCMICRTLGFPGGSDSEEPACNVGDLSSIPGLSEFLWRRAWQPTPVFLPGESPWTEETIGLQSMRLQRVGHNWVTKHAELCNMFLRSLLQELLVVLIIANWKQLKCSLIIT